MKVITLTNEKADSIKTMLEKSSDPVMHHIISMLGL